MTSNQSDIAIIGGGIGGLICGAILAKQGYQISLFDSNAQLGGSLQVFSRDKTVFDSGVHYLGGLEKGENLYQIFKYLDILDQLDIQKMNPNGYEHFQFGNEDQVYKIPMGWDRFESKLIDYFPAEKDNIQKYVQDVQDCCEQFKLYNLIFDPHEQPKLEYQSLSLYDYLENLTSNKTLQKILAGNALLYASGKESTPFHLHALTINSYVKGAFKLVNSGAQLTKALRKVIRDHNGEIHLRTKITSAEINNQTVKSIIDQKGNRFYADTYISSIHPALMIDIMGKENFKKSFSRRIKNLPNSTSAFSLFLNLEDNAFPYMDHNYFYASDHPLEMKDQRSNFHDYFMLSTPVYDQQGDYAKAANIMTFMNIDVFNPYGEDEKTIANPNKRSEAYERFKKELENELLNRVAEKFPQLRSATVRMESSTPLTFRDYLQSPQGSIYGIVKDAQKPIHSILAPSTHLKNLYLAGQSFKLHGVVGVAMSSLLTLSQLVDGKELIQDIKNA